MKTTLRYLQHSNALTSLPRRRRSRRRWARIVFAGLGLAWFAWAVAGVWVHATELAKVAR